MRQHVPGAVWVAGAVVVASVVIVRTGTYTRLVFKLHYQ